MEHGYYLAESRRTARLTRMSERADRAQEQAPAAGQGADSAISSPFTLPKGLPETPKGSAWHALVAQFLFHTGLIRASESLSRRVWWRRDADAPGLRLQRVTEPRFAILCYHRIGTAGVPLHSALPRQVFESQMAYLRKHYRLISMEKLLTEAAEPRNNEPAVAVTFDDGYADLYREAFPVLREYSIPATIYLIVGSTQSGEVPWYDRIFVAFQATTVSQLRNELDLPATVPLDSPRQRLVAAARYILCIRELPDAERRMRCERLERLLPTRSSVLVNRMLNWGQIREMQSAGISFGSHSMAHPVLSRLSAADLVTELRDSRQILQNELQRPILDFAYPFGTPDSFNRETRDQLGAFGYRSAVTSFEGVNTPTTNRFSLQRVTYCECASLPIFVARLSRLFLVAHEKSPANAA